MPHDDLPRFAIITLMGLRNLRLTFLNDEERVIGALPAPRREPESEQAPVSRQDSSVAGLVSGTTSPVVTGAGVVSLTGLAALLRSDAPGLAHQDHAGGDVPRLQPDLPETLAPARRDISEVQRRGAEAAHR
ncbi:hypothetical protein BJV78DRAFT_1280000 [Lactifluus subvellereus]|nr:hypothetical protein BJV78DRAFT_1280000 [Lactifluus subvellereus]